MERIQAFAKVNLTLDILGIRDDGYHEIASVMQAVSLSDALSVEVHHDGVIEVQSSDLSIPSGPDNLAYRAAAILRRRSGRPGLGARIYIEKKIPAGAGLAGGSADAAAAIKALNRLWGINLGQEELRVLAADIGSDVPFCLSGGCALVGGRGEKLEPLPDLSGYWLVLVKPDFALDTRYVYRLYDSYGPKATCYTEGLLSAIRRRGGVFGPESLALLLGNALEEVVLKAHPSAGKTVALIESIGYKPVMSGSGSTFFFPVLEGEAEKAAMTLRDRGLWAEAVKPLGRS